MAKENANVHVYDDQNYAVFVGTAGTSAPSTFTLDSNGNVVPPSGFVEVGLLSDNGITEAHNMNETKIYDMAGSLIRIARNQEERPFTFEAMEDNAMVRRLLYRSTTSTSGATAEVQTLTISGSPTGGTFSVTLAGYGTASGINYNAAASTVQTALRSAWGLAVDVTGSAGGPYTITYPTAAGNVPLAAADGSTLTGGTSPSAAVVVATPGVTGVNSTPVGSGTGRDLRPFCIVLKDGSVVKLISINSGEATQTGTVAYTGSGAAIYQFTVQPYKDANGNYFTILDNDPAQGEASD
jgi:hypothetical protein